MPDLEADIAPFGERGWLARLRCEDDPVATGLAMSAAAARLRRRPGVDDAVAAINSLAMRFNPAVLTPEAARRALAAALDGAPGDQPGDAPDEAAPARSIPVAYGGDFGPDFDDVCAATGLSPAALIDAHAGGAYRVAAIGFAPGFAYLGPLAPALRVPRLRTPRVRAPAGSVAIAGGFTGVYPLASPGGWRIIGRTPMRLFNPHDEDPFTLTAGARVAFTPISADAFETMAGAA